MSATDAGAGQVHLLREASERAEDRLLWARLREAETPEAFSAAWLAIQCRAIQGVEAGLVLAEAAYGRAYEPVASWPDGASPGGHLFSAGERVLQERRALALQLDPQARGAAGASESAEGASDTGAPGSGSRTVIAQPVQAAGRLVGAVVLDVTPRPEAELERALRQLTWGAAWLDLRALRLAGTSGKSEGLETLLQLIATPLDHERFRPSATAFVTELATRFDCERVSFGSVARDQTVELEAVSHSSEFGKRTNLSRAIERAMDEALDQEKSVLWPAPGDAAPQVTRDHAVLASESEAGAICSIPAAHGAHFCSVFTFERGAGRRFDPAELELMESAVSFAAPTLDLQRREERWLGAKAWEAFRTRLDELVGPRHVALKLGVGIGVFLLAFMTLAKGDFRVTADMALEARVLRAAVAPFDGYVAEAPARAGDVVREGDLLARLDDRELALERTRWSSQLQQLTKQHRQALGERDAAQVTILGAQIDQARAQLGLAEDRLGRTLLTAPFDGVVVTGDLSQQLGAPVQRGQMLFEVAPLDEYRVVLEVDERDIEEVIPGQTGTLAFSAFPDESFHFAVQSVTPVSTPSEGRNTFRVEARLAEAPPRLRPGMEGIAKVEVDRRRLLWIWGHEVSDWLRLKLWRWLP